MKEVKRANLIVAKVIRKSSTNTVKLVRNLVIINKHDVQIILNILTVCPVLSIYLNPKYAVSIIFKCLNTLSNNSCPFDVLCNT